MRGEGEMTLSRLPHPAIVCGSPQLLKVIEELEAGTCPQPEDAIWRDDLPRELAVRLALATGATIEQIEAGPGEYAEAGPQTEPEPEPEVGEDEADAIIRHTHEDGTLVYGTSKGDGTAGILKANRFRWFPSLKLWGVPQSRDHLAKRWQISAAAGSLRKAGFKVRVEIDDTPRDVAEVKADRAGRLDDRYERLTAKAQRNAAECAARMVRADEIASARNGQPRLAGHHSARRWDADQKRIEQNDRAAQAAYGEAKRAAAAAAVVGTADAYRELPAVITRRIDRTEAELRQAVHYIEGTRPANDWRGAYGYQREPASGEWLESLTARKAFLEHQLAADREALAEHEANGYMRLTRESIHKGDVVTWSSRFGEEATVTRTNPKTVTLDRASYPRTLPYEQIRSVQCPHEGTATAVRAPRRATAKRAAPAVAAGRPAVREAPLTVDARTECFATPAPVVKRMIETAGLEPGMTVLEPSAGTGAIARPAAELGAEVTCIELDHSLWQRLAADGRYRSVQHGDFLEAGPADGPLYDRVLMNPPFRGQADIRHVTHALSFVKPGGMVIAIMPASAGFRQDKTAEAFRTLVAGCGGRFERLPDDAFEASGTSVRTVMAVIPAAG
jgi:predicted RNA methylase